MIKSLTTIRFFLFLLIFCGHLKDIAVHSPVGKSLFNVLNQNSFAVLFFFVLSGFCISLGYQKKFEQRSIKSTVDFLLKRFLKLYPLYLLTGIICLVFIFVPNNEEWIYVFIGLYVPMLFPWTHYVSGGGNPVAWFTAAIFFCYLLSPIMLYYLNKIKKLSGLMLYILINFLILMIICVIILNFNQQNDDFFYKLPLIRLFQYSIGLGLGFVYQKYIYNCRYLFENYYLKSFVDLIFLLIIFEIFLIPKDIVISNIVFLPIICIIILYLCNINKSISNIYFDSKIILFLSNISMECYLIHFVVMLLLQNISIKYIYSYSSIFFLSIFLLILTIIFSVLYKICSSKIESFFVKDRLLNGKTFK